MRILKIDRETELAVCEDADGSRSTVEVALLEATGVGDTVLVHAGVALAHLEGGPA